MNAVNVLMLVGLLVFLFLYIRAERRLRQAVNGAGAGKLTCMEVTYTIISTLPVLAMCAGWIHLPLFYLLSYGTNSLLRLLNREDAPGKWLLVNVRFLIFTAPHLVVTGVLALCIHTDMAGVLGDFVFRTLSLIIVTMLNTGILSALPRHLHMDHLRGLRWDAEELQLFTKFVWFCACSVVCDSIPSLFPLPKIFPLVFLIGSNVLLMMMAFLFAHHVYTIMRDSYLKEESMRLWEEALEQRGRTAKLEREAYRDVLTKIYTRQYALSNMRSMLTSGEAFALGFLDLDRLKQVNDLQGHLAGDEYLCQFSAHMKERLRPNDIFARYGGDEFLILMPDLAYEEAAAQLSSIQSDASAALPAGWGTPFSFGLVAAQPDAGMGAEEWIAMADRAMYEDKIRRRACRKGEP